MKLNDARPIAPADAVTEPWWDATREGRFTVQRCDACGNEQLYPRAICTSCGSLQLSLSDASGRGTVYSYTLVRRAPHPAFEAPYLVALVRLEEGPVVLTNLIDVDADEPQAANALLVGKTVVCAEAFPRTRARLGRHGLQVKPVAVDELAKAEGGVTCCALVFER